MIYDMIFLYSSHSGEISKITAAWIIIVGMEYGLFIII